MREKERRGKCLDNDLSSFYALLETLTLEADCLKVMLWSLGGPLVIESSGNS